MVGLAGGRRELVQFCRNHSRSLSERYSVPAMALQLVRSGRRVGVGVLD
jgi:hypothetical protein